MNINMLKKEIGFNPGVEESGDFDGDATLFGQVDSDGEVVEAGSFAESLRAKNGIVPILWAHNKDQPVGWSHCEETTRGLRVKGKLMLNTERGRYAHEFMKAGRKIGGSVGLSIGFSVLPGGSYYKDGHRRFTKCELHEYSVVVFPACPGAGVTGVKTMDMDSTIKAASEAEQTEVQQALENLRHYATLLD